MFFKGISRNYLWISLSLFLICFIIWFPGQWIITDSHNYSSLAIGITHGQTQGVQYDFITGEVKDIVNAPYLLGNSFYLAFILFFFGDGNIFLAGLLAVLGSTFFLFKALRASQLPDYSIVLLFLSLPILFFSRTLMPAMPSMLVISGFLWCYAIPKKSKSNLILLGFIAGLSVWFRETNGIITGLLCLYCVYKTPRHISWIFLGGISGLSIRLITSYNFYGDVFFKSASAGFGFEHFFPHLGLYIAIGLLFVPGGLLWIGWKTKHRNIFWVITTVVFFLVYTLYNYSAVPYSGFIKGSLLTSRFIIPWIPLAVIAFGYIIKEKELLQKLVIKIALPLSLVFIILSQFGFHQFYKKHEEASAKLALKYSNEYVIYDQSGYTNIIRYINPFTGKWKHVSHIESFGFAGNPSLEDPFRNGIKQEIKSAYLVLSISNASEAKIKRSHRWDGWLTTGNHRYIESINIDENNRLDVYRVSYY